MPQEQSILLAELKGATTTHIWARIDPSGNFHMEGQDLGQLPEMTFGEDEYEYIVSVEADQIGHLLLLLVKELYSGDISAVAKFRQWLIANDLPFKFEAI